MQNIQSISLNINKVKNIKKFLEQKNENDKNKNKKE